jgi:hypothetical protein
VAERWGSGDTPSTGTNGRQAQTGIELPDGRTYQPKAEQLAEDDVSPVRILTGFIAGFLSVLVFQSGLIAVLHGGGLIPFAPWSMNPVPPFGVPQVLSGAFWGGLWGIVYAWLEPWLTARLPWWLGGLLFGATLPVLVLLFIVIPLKGGPVGGNAGLAGIPLMVGIHAFFGLGTAVFFRVGQALTAKRLPA